jgi:hypothetical protein
MSVCGMRRCPPWRLMLRQSGGNLLALPTTLRNNIVLARDACASGIHRFVAFARSWLSALTDHDRNWRGEDRWIVGDVIGVAKQQLQRMPARRERDSRFRLPCAEMKMIFIVWDGFVKVGEWAVYEQMVVAAIRSVNAGPHHFHLVQTKADLKS